MPRIESRLAKLDPAPTRDVPILIGGQSKPALRRAARLGDGWISAGSSFEELEDMARDEGWAVEGTIESF